MKEVVVVVIEDVLHKRRVGRRRHEGSYKELACVYPSLKSSFGTVLDNLLDLDLD